MLKHIKNQRGAAVVFELVLVVAVVAFAGLGVYRYYQETNHVPSASNPEAAASSSPTDGSTKPNGTVNDTVNALTAEANAEAQDSASESSSVQSVDSTTQDAANVSGAYNENQF